MTFLKNIRNDLIAVVSLVFISSGLIFYQFGMIPKGLHFDEIEFAKLALSLAKQSYIVYSPLATGHATLYFYILLAALKTFGINTIALRLPSALFGVMNVILFYYIMKAVFKKTSSFPFLPFFLTLIFATLKWYFNFARFSFEATFLLFLEFISVISMLTFIDKKKWFYLMLSGIFAGLAYNSYTAGRFFVLIPPLLLLTNWKGKSSVNFLNLKRLFTYFIPFLILILPITIYLSQHQDIRIYQLLYLQNTELSLIEKLQFFGQNIVTTAKMFHFSGDMNGVHNYPGKPALNPFIGIIFVGGLLLSIKNWNKKYNLFFIIYFFLSIFPTLLTYPWENPHMLRTYTTIPSIIYFSGIFLLFIVEKTKRYKSIALNIMIIAILISSIYEVRGYFRYQADVLDHAFRYSEELPYYLRLSDKQFDKINK